MEESCHSTQPPIYGVLGFELTLGDGLRMCDVASYMDPPHPLLFPLYIFEYILLIGDYTLLVVSLLETSFWANFSCCFRSSCLDKFLVDCCMFVLVCFGLLLLGSSLLFWNLEKLHHGEVGAWLLKFSSCIYVNVFV